MEPNSSPESADAPAYPQQGYEYFIAGQFEAAIAAYDRVLAINPDNYTAWYSKGSILAKLGLKEAAIANYDRALAINPDAVKAWYDRGLALADLERYEEAIASYDRALAISPNAPEISFNKGAALLRLARLRAWELTNKDLLNQHPELVALYELERQALQSADQHIRSVPLSPQEPHQAETNTVPATNLVTAARRSPAPAQVQRFVLRDRPTAAERQYYQTYIAELQQLNTNWKILPDQPKPGEAAAHVAIYQDADADVRYKTYLMTRCIEDVVADFRLS